MDAYLDEVRLADPYEAEAEANLGLHPDREEVAAERVALGLLGAAHLDKSPLPVEHDLLAARLLAEDFLTERERLEAGRLSGLRPAAPATDSGCGPGHDGVVWAFSFSARSLDPSSRRRRCRSVCSRSAPALLIRLCLS